MLHYIHMSKIIRACTVPQSLGFVKGMLPDMGKKYEVVLVSSPEIAEKLRKDDCFTFLFVGRIVRDKGINELCRAFDKLSGVASVRLLLRT